MRYWKSLHLVYTTPLLYKLEKNKYEQYIYVSEQIFL